MVTKTVEESAALALKKGCDVNCGNTYIHLMKAYKDGLVTEEEITRACVRLYTTRFMLGLFDGSEYDSIPYEKVECREHRDYAVSVAEKAMVLLKNDGFLPLNKGGVKTIGVIGPDANSRVALIGNYHGTASRYTTIFEGIQDEAGPNINVLFSEGSHLYKDRVEALAVENDRLAEARFADGILLAIICKTVYGIRCDIIIHRNIGPASQCCAYKITSTSTSQIRIQHSF